MALEGFVPGVLLHAAMGELPFQPRGGVLENWLTAALLFNQPSRSWSSSHSLALTCNAKAVANGLCQHGVIRRAELAWSAGECFGWGGGAFGPSVLSGLSGRGNASNTSIFPSHSERLRVS